MSDSLITKRAIATSIKELMRKKSFPKISVSDIVQNCGINRQTFYYHFKDKYDLVNWIYYDEVVAVIRSKRFDDWNEIVLAILTSMNREQHFYKNVLNNIEQNTDPLFLDFSFSEPESTLNETHPDISNTKQILF